METRLPFKLRQAIRAGGTLAPETLNHPSLLMNRNAAGGGSGNMINMIVQVLGEDKMQFIVDSGAALSVVHYDTVNPVYHQRIQKEGVVCGCWC